MKKLGLAALTAGALMVAGNANAVTNLVENGGFDLPNPDPGLFPILDWGNGLLGNFVIGDEIGYVSGPNAFNFGDQVDGSGVEIDQLVTTLVAGRKYILTFDLAEGGDSTGNYFHCFQFVRGGPSVTLNNSGPFGFKQYTLDFTPPSNQIDLIFEGFDNGGWFALDNVSIVAAPEPATWALMLAGFAGLGAALRSRRQRAFRVSA